MTFNIEINEERIVALVEKEIVKQVFEQCSHMATSAKNGVKHGVETAVKEYIYAKKDEIIEKVVARATTEIVRKGIPKLLEGMK